MIYLDYNATAPMKPAVQAAVVEAMERAGNPSSVHRYGRAAKRAIEDSRAKIAAFVGVSPSQVVFTSGGTEANNMALRRDDVCAVYVAAIEHDSVLACCPDMQRIPVDINGVVDLAAAEALMVAAPKPSLFAVMLVNNETGVVQPIATLAALAHRYGHLFHSDCVQALGRLPVDFKALGIDSLSCSAHKLGGPHGVGALILSEEANISPLLLGGGQEKRRRSGTENIEGIVGFGVAAHLAADDLRDMPRLAHLRDILQQSLVDMGGSRVRVFGADVERVANTLCLGLSDTSAETQVIAMDLAGVAVSAGSACSSGKVHTSHVLQAMHVGETWATSAVRFSLGWKTTDQDIEKCIKAWASLYGRLEKENSHNRAA